MELRARGYGFRGSILGLSFDIGVRLDRTVINNDKKNRKCVANYYLFLFCIHSFIYLFIFCLLEDTSFLHQEKIFAPDICSRFAGSSFPFHAPVRSERSCGTNFFNIKMAA